MFNSVLSALTLSSLAVAASSTASSCSFSTKITSPTDIAQLNACTKLSGTIQIGGDTIGSIDLSNVQEIAADIKFFNSSSVTSINLNTLSKISGSLAVEAYTQLFSIDFTDLVEVDTLSLVSLPSFATINVNKGVSKATSIQISDTALHSLDGLINFSKIDTLDINNNKNISSIDLPLLVSVGENLILSFNSDKCDVKLDTLSWASNMTVQDVSDLSAGNLTAVNGSMVLGYNTFSSLDLSTLKTVGGSVRLFANDELTDVDLSSLSTIGGELYISNNTILEDMDKSFENVTKIEGAVDIQGDIANFTLSSLDSVAGDFSFTSTNENFDCTDLNKLYKDEKILGHDYNCSAPTKAESSSKSGASSASGSSATGSGTSTSFSTSSATATKKSEGNSNLGPFVGITCAIGAALALII